MSEEDGVTDKTTDNAKIREAMLAAQARWLEEANNAELRDEPTARTVALVIADAFEVEARRYKNGDPNGETLVDQHPELALDEDRWRVPLLDTATENVRDGNQRIAWDEINKS